MHSLRTHQKSQPNGTTVPSHPPSMSSSSSSTSNPYGGFYNQMPSYGPPPTMYASTYSMYGQSLQQPPLPPS